jgi:hypothetical protein
MRLFTHPNQRKVAIENKSELNKTDMSKKYYANCKRLIACIRVVFLLLFFAVTSCSQTRKRGVAIQLRPVDYVITLIGTAPVTDKKFLGNSQAPGEELYTGTVNPGAMVPNPNGKVCAGPVSGFDGQRYHVHGSGYRYYDETIMGFTNLNGEYHDANKLLLMPTIGAIKTIPESRENPFVGYRSAKDTLMGKHLKNQGSGKMI